MREAAHRVPPRHCTGCGIRMWSFNKTYVKTTYDAKDWRDVCADCDIGVPTRHRAARLFRRAAR